MPSFKQDLHWEIAKQRVCDLLATQGIQPGKARFLLAVSGGMDSMCMLEIFADLQAEVGVAHVNYGLRGEESDADAALVKSRCADLGIPYFVNTLSLKTLLKEQSGNLQKVARDLRYEWFDHLLQEHHYTYICTAHQRDDAAESFFINLLRGTGLKGLSGIAVLREHILRPMLCFSRAEIHGFVTSANITYREDASNRSRDYLRNRIRHDLIPLFIAEQPRFIERMVASQRRLAGEYAILSERLAAVAEELSRREDGMLTIDYVKLLTTTAPDVVLHDVLREYGFNMFQCRRMTDRQPHAGARYYSKTHEVVFDRGRLLVRLATAGNDEIYELAGTGKYVLPNGIITLQHAEAVQFTGDPAVEYVDAAKFTQPLHLRRWQPGDFFCPLGTSGRQKLQDFFTNEKVSIPVKEQTWILTCGDDIVWICGMRLDDRYKVGSATGEVLRLEWQPF